MTKTVLAVDDNKTFLEMYGRMITRKYHDFFGTQNPLDALERLRKSMTIDLLITDLNMPHLTGDQLISQFHLSSPSTKYLLVTARDSETVNPILERLRSEGIQVTYLQKPSSLTEISSAVDSLIG